MSKKSASRSKYALLEHSTQRSCEILESSTIGRENTDIVFPALVSLSRQHFRIVIDEDGPWIEDLGSSNGTKLNGTKLEPRKKTSLSNGDCILAGKVVMTFQIRPSMKKNSAGELELEQPGHFLEPEILLVNSDWKWPSKKPNKEEAPASDPLEEHLKKKKRVGYSFLGPQWTTFFLLLGLAALARQEIVDIRRSPYQIPHSHQDMILRYVFSVGIMYLLIVLLQFLFTLTIARRWFTALPAIALSAYIGSLAGDKLDYFAEYKKAEVENRIQGTQANTAKKERRAGSKSDRSPAQQ